MQMESHEDACEKLDGDFDHFLVDMKPFVLKLPHKSDRQRCALWIKKLCEPPVARSGALGISSRKNRNDYARLLLHMLRRSVLEEPFTHRPDTGPLKTLPTYMAIYFDEPLEDIVASREPPDWVTGALDAPEETSKRSLKEDERSGPHLSFDSTCSRHRTSSENEGASRQLHALSQSAALGPVLKRSFKRTQVRMVYVVCMHDSLIIFSSIPFEVLTAQNFNAHQFLDVWISLLFLSGISIGS
ncbi:centrosomal protein of 112 kDa-like [Petromyzon marinus]|uniref:centrosomal protein of 112 kDa-like n=1 Tax=Petromyzon marinus TaxID=7757 RepID=UPI003F72DD68